MTGKGLFLKNIKNGVRERELVKLRNRRQETVLHRLRTGHVGLKSYLCRIGLSETEECEYCDVPETPDHYLLECVHFENQREVMFRELFRMGVNNPTLKCILGGCREHYRIKVKIYETLLRFVSATNRIKIL